MAAMTSRSASPSERNVTNFHPSLEQRFSDSAPTNEFIEYVNSVRQSHKGRNGLNQERFFVPQCALNKYWARPADRVRAVCDSYNPNIYRTSSAITRKSYLRVFSTLVYTGLLAFLPDFLEHELTDEHFPRNDLPGFWANSPPHKDMFEKFRDHQWSFFPVILDSDKLVTTRLLDERILPISSKEEIRKSDATIIHKVQFHESCINLDNFPSEGHGTNRFYALKTYRGQRYKDQWNTEVRAFNALQGNDSNHVVKCYGTFIHGDTFNLILQWIDGPNLLEFILSESFPSCAREVLDLWTSLTKVFTGLHHLHQFAFEIDNVATYQLVHQDIKLDNILLGLTTDGPFSYTPYIADFGCSHYSHVDSSAMDRGGNQMYSAPEAIRDAGSRWSGTSHLKSEADIFAMGAVLSDVATWVAFGQAGRKQYLEKRRREIQGLRDISHSGYEGTFHNGAGPLRCVEDMHQSIRRGLPLWDNVTPLMLDIIDEYMLTATNRRTAKFLSFTIENKLDEIRKQQALLAAFSDRATDTVESEAVLLGDNAPPSPVASPIHTPRKDMMLDSSTEVRASQHSLLPVITGTMQATHLDRDAPKMRSMPCTPLAESTSKGRLQESPCIPRSESVPLTRLSMLELRAYREARRVRQPANPAVEAVIEQLESNLSRRDHLFLIDDTATMKAHLPQIKEALNLLGYIAKKLDPDDLELVFASDPNTVIRAKHTSPLLKALSEHKFQAFTGTMETGLGTLVSKFVIPRLPKRIAGKMVSLKGRRPSRPKPMTIFVFTDGQWGPGVQRGNGLHQPIVTLMKKMKERGLVRTHVMIQFIRFGQDAEGKAHLQYLDDFGKEEDYDLVDTRDITGDVSSMFVGSLTQAYDDDDSVSSAPLQ